MHLFLSYPRSFIFFEFFLKSQQSDLSCMLVSAEILITVNVLKLRTLKNNNFSDVRNFRNYVSEKVLVFVILECGLYLEQKRYISM